MTHNVPDNVPSAGDGEHNTVPVLLELIKLVCGGGWTIISLRI